MIWSVVWPFFSVLAWLRVYYYYYYKVRGVETRSRSSSSSWCDPLPREAPCGPLSTLPAVPSHHRSTRGALRVT